MRMHDLRSLLGISLAIKVVDVGASAIDGPAPYTPLRAGPGGAAIVGFEPNRQALADLARRAPPSDRYLPHAVGDGRRRTLHYCRALGMTSLLQPNPEVLALFGGFPEWGQVVETERIDTVRLDDVPETAGLDVLKLDVQGAELMVLQNARRRLGEALVIHTEVEFLPMYQDQPLFAEIEQYLRRQGFLFHCFAGLAPRAVQPLQVANDQYGGLNQLLWADAVFIRSFVDMAKFAPERLLRMATIRRASTILRQCSDQFRQPISPRFQAG